jgi:hypothetical protein
VGWGVGGGVGRRQRTRRLAPGAWPGRARVAAEARQLLVAAGRAHFVRKKMVMTDSADMPISFSRSLRHRSRQGGPAAAGSRASLLPAPWGLSAWGGGEWLQAGPAGGRQGAAPPAAHLRLLPLITRGACLMTKT